MPGTSCRDNCKQCLVCNGKLWKRLHLMKGRAYSAMMRIRRAVSEFSFARMG